MYGDEIYLRPVRKRERERESKKDILNFTKKEKTDEAKRSKVKSSSATQRSHLSEVKDETNIDSDAKCLHSEDHKI